MFAISRLSKNRLSNWWWTVDKLTLSLVFVLMFIGTFLVFSASPSVARTHGWYEYHFIKQQIFWFIVGVSIILSFSILKIKHIRRLAIAGYLAAICLVILTHFMGVEIKGGTRWVSIFGINLQPSEFVKPTFVVVSAWLLEGSKKSVDFPGGWLSFLLAVLTGLIVGTQPDIGMTIVIALVWGMQIFLSGLKMRWVMVLAFLGILALIGAYFTFDHVQSRIDNFIFPQQELGYQIRRSLEAFANGNLLGRGPGEGTVKHHLPDAHTDFIFAVAGEEFGIWLCLILVALFSIIVVRTFMLAFKENNLFVIYAASGLAASLGLQAIINMAVALHLGPTKGMTMPFISYGGSSMAASALCVGMLLAITRRNAVAESKDF